MSSHKTLCEVINERSFACSTSLLHSSCVSLLSVKARLSLCPFLSIANLLFIIKLGTGCYEWGQNQSDTIQTRMCVNFLDVLSFDAFHFAVAMATENFFHSDCCSTTLPDVSSCNESTIKKQIKKGYIISHVLLCMDVLLCTIYLCLHAKVILCVRTTVPDSCTS